MQIKPFLPPFYRPVPGVMFRIFLTRFVSRLFQTRCVFAPEYPDIQISVALVSNNTADIHRRCYKSEVVNLRQFSLNRSLGGQEHLT